MKCIYSAKLFLSTLKKLVLDTYNCVYRNADLADLWKIFENRFLIYIYLKYLKKNMTEMKLIKMFLLSTRNSF